MEEVAPLTACLSQNGFTVSCPHLKGHTGTKKDLRGVSYAEWIKSAEDGLIQLKSECEYIIVIGFSMGGLIALNLSMRHRIDGIITLNMPIYFWDIKRIMLNIRENRANLKRYIKASFDKPLSALINFLILLKKSKGLIKYVVCPVFIAQALEDDTVQKRSAGYIYENAQSEYKIVRYYKDSGHLICHSKAFEEVSEDIIWFIGNSTNIYRFKKCL